MVRCARPPAPARLTRRSKGRTSPLTGEPIIVVAAGAVVDGRGLAASLPVDVAGDVHLAANVEDGRLRLERLAERPYYL